MKSNIRSAVLLAASLATAPALAAPEVKSEGAFEIAGGDISLSVGGNLMLDFVEPVADISQISRNLYFRRARIELAGRVHEDWGFRFEYDFAEGQTAARDVYLSYSGLEHQEVLIGQFKQPWSLEELSADDQLAFMERSLMNGAWSTAHRIGLGWRQFGDHHSFMASIYGKESGDSNAGVSDEPISFGARVVWSPIRSDERLLHLGIAMAEEKFEDGAGTYLLAQPEANPSGNVVLYTGFVADATGLSKVGLEAAWMSGGLSVQGEYQTVSLASQAEGDPSFSGYYVEARWFPAGEIRPYDMSSGAFSMIKPSSIDGAWEFKVRMSSLDLEDSCLARVVLPPCVGVNSQAGNEDNLAFGATYYANANIRWMVEYISADVDAAFVQTLSILQGRFQLVW